MLLTDKTYRWQSKKYNMFEKEPQFINSEEKKPERKEKTSLEELKEYIKEMSLELRKEGIPVDERARIDVNKFNKVYSEASISSDMAWVKDLKTRFEKTAASNSQWAFAFPKEKALRDVPLGGVFEMLATSVLNKKMGKDFIITRTSEYDDIRRKMDNIILERKTGNIVCAFDEIGAVSGERFEEKENKVLERNWKRGGADLKYGIFFEKKAGKMELKKGPIYHIPLFYLAMSEKDIKDALDNQGQQEQVFYKFVESIKKQIEKLKEYPVHSKLKERLDYFEKSIEKF